MSTSDEPKIVILDIETLPNIVTTWGLKVYGEYLAPENILIERSILCAAWKWLGEEKVESISILENFPAPSFDDIHIVTKLKSVLDSADVVVAHNGDKFDLPWIRTRLLYHGLGPYKPLVSVDTYKLAKVHFHFNSNKMDYVSQFLAGQAKTKTEYSLWLRALQLDRAAIQEIVDYNKDDVNVLEGIYEKLRPFVKNPWNRAIGDQDSRTCPSCGAEALKKHGFTRSQCTIMQRLLCTSCGAWSKKPMGSSIVRQG